jgi:hypothetical protein
MTITQEAVSRTHTPIPARPLPDICADLDSLRGDVDTYARLTAQAYLDSDPMVAHYAAKFAEIRAKHAQTLAELQHALGDATEKNGGRPAIIFPAPGK